MTPFNADDFWQYSLTIYENPNVKTLCLKLQDHWHFNVNLMLLCCWLHRQHVTLSIEDIRLLLEAIKASDESILNQRQKRKEQVRGSVSWQQCLDEELQLEAQQQRILVLHLTQLTIKPLDNGAPSGLANYFKIMPASSLPYYLELANLLENDIT